MRMGSVQFIEGMYSFSILEVAKCGLCYLLIEKYELLTKIEQDVPTYAVIYLFDKW